VYNKLTFARSGHSSQRTMELIAYKVLLHIDE
jgi:hypothetical protein